MSGQTMNFKRYNEYIKTMSEPMMPSQLPKKSLNLSAIAKHIRENNISVTLLSDEEKERIMKYVK